MAHTLTRVRNVAEQDAVVAKQYISEPETFAATARVWTQNFASPAQADAPDAKVRHFPAGDSKACRRSWAWSLPTETLHCRSTEKPSAKHRLTLCGQRGTPVCGSICTTQGLVTVDWMPFGCSGIEAGRDGLR